jgi:16S rRNA (guanine527-N7)-methyltransferase
VADNVRRAELESGLAVLGLNLSVLQVDALIEFVELLARWNQSYKLTAVTDRVAMVSRHLLDSLSVMPGLAGRRIADVGSGAGLPGIPLAIARPDLEFVLLDSVGKKTRFMTHAVGRLGLDNVRVARTRVEDYADEVGFDTVVSRAFASLADFVRLAGGLCAPAGRLVAMKGRLKQDELAGLVPGWRIVETQQLAVPGTQGARHLVIMQRDPHATD